MILEAGLWAFNRYRPREGWLSLILVVSAITCVIMAIDEIGWVPEDAVVVPAALIGLLLGVVLAKRPLSTWVAWTFITLYGLLVVLLTLSNLWPPVHLLFGHWSELRQLWLQNGASFLDRSASWIETVASGGSSAETIIFAVILGLAVWFLAAYVGWSTFRQQRPLLGLTLMGILLGLNVYYGNGSIYWVPIFVGIAVIAAAVLNFANLEQKWQTHNVDYSREIRTELILYASAIGITLLALALLLPGINLSKIAQNLLTRPAVSSAEDSLARAFAGVRQPLQAVPPGAQGGSGTMPRSFLLGNAPQLSETIMMTAKTQVLEGNEDAAWLNGRHWRALSYEIYTGRGWTLSSERNEPLRPFEAIPLPAAEAQATLNQDVDWIHDKRATRYTLGQPIQFNQATVTSWRGLDDLVRVRSESGSQYAALTRVSTATADELRAASLADVPPALLNRYTNLPASVPRRVHELAVEIGADLPTAYDQAFAIEQFLRQYTYTLELEAPPTNVDLVDYFLFDLQKGYCDYYASAMVVLARSLGLPARMATGFLAQPVDAEGVQTIRQIHAHSWAEIYFEPYGWIEFEPTAAFVTPHNPPPDFFDSADQYIPDDSAYEAPPIPERAPQKPLPWKQIIIVLGLAVAVLLIGWRQYIKRTDLDDVQWAYGRLQDNATRLGQSPQANQTPHEFNRQFLAYLDKLAQRPHLESTANTMKKPVNKITSKFVARQYSMHKTDEGENPKTVWQQLKRPLRLLRLLRRLKIIN